MPAVFAGHGSPMNAVGDNAYRRAWREIGGALPRPAAILCISAHWMTRGVYVGGAERPETIHDFYGFPEELYAVRYAAPGDPDLARRTAALLKYTNAAIDPSYGLDHGSWGVLSSMYPDADVPVAQLSLDLSRPAQFHYALGRRLAPLRDEGVLILGSGNIVHNLRHFLRGPAAPYEWAEAFDRKVKERIVSGDHQPLIEFETLGPEARLSVPTPEHYLPLLYVLAVQNEHDRVGFFNESVSSAMSMTSVILSADGTAG